MPEPWKFLERCIGLTDSSYTYGISLRLGYKQESTHALARLAHTSQHYEFGDNWSTDLQLSELQHSLDGMNWCQPIRYGYRTTLSGINDTCHAKWKCCLTRQNFLFNVGKVSYFFLAYEERQVSPINIQWALHQRVPTLVKAPSKFPLLSALTMNLLTRSISWVLLTSKVLQTDSAYMPGSLVRFLLLVRLEMLS